MGTHQGVQQSASLRGHDFYRSPLISMEGVEFVFPGESSSEQGVLVDSASNRYSNFKRYTPVRGDVVIGVVTFKTAEFYRVDIRASSPGILPVTAFNGATKRHRPELKVGVFVLCWVVGASEEVELSCEDSGTQRDWSSGDTLFGVLIDSGNALMLEISLTYADFLQSDAPIFRSFARHVKAEISVGRNGRVFIRSEGREETLAISKSIIHGERMSPVQIEAYLRALLK